MMLSGFSTDNSMLTPFAALLLYSDSEAEPDSG